MSASLTVTFAGSGDAFGNGGRLQACVLLEWAEERVLLDCGASSLVGLKRLGVDPNTIRTVVLSHLHGDHFGGVPFLVLDGQFSRRTSPLRIVGPPGTDERVMAAMEVLFPGSSRVERRFPTAIEEVSAGTSVPVGDGVARVFAADHASGAPAHHLRIEAAGHAVAYSGDTAWTPGLAEAARGADLLVCEGYFLERRVPYHLSVAELRERREQLECRRVVLTHMTNEVIAAELPDFERAFDGMVIELRG